MEPARGIQETVKRVSASVRGIAGPDAADVVQEAVARAIKNGVDPESEAWLRTVARRVAIDRKRRSREYASGAAADLERYSKSGEGDPEDAIIRAERSAQLHEALDRLPARYRKALLAYAEEDSPAAVAKRLGLSASATWTLLSRARSRLRVQLEQIGFVPVTIFGNGRWRAIVASGAAAGVAAGVALHGVLPKADRPSAPSRPKIVQAAAAPVAAKPGTAAPRSVLPKVTLPSTDVAVPSVPDVAPPQALKTCIKTPQVALIPAIPLYVIPNPRLSDRVARVLPQPLEEVSTHLCTTDE